MTLPALRDLINQHFNDDELRQLCFDLDIEYENLPGDTRIIKAQSLVQYSLRHHCLPDLGKQCVALRPTVEWPDLDVLAVELSEVQKTADTLTGTVTDETLLEAMLTPLRQKEAGLLTQLMGSGVVAQGDGDKTTVGNISSSQGIATGSGATAVGEQGVLADMTGDNNHIGNIVTIYRAGGNGRISDEQLQREIAAYARWVTNSYGRIRLRGLGDREHEIPDPNLPDVYVSLVAQSRTSQRRDTEQDRESIDMSNLLAQGNKLVITGAPGSGKTTFLRHIAHLLADAIYTGDETAVRQQLNLEGDQLPLPIYLSLGDYYRYKQEHQSGTLIKFISYTLIQQHGVYNLPDDFFAQMLSRENTVCLLLDSLDEIPTENGRSQATKSVIELADNDIGQILVASRDHAYVGRVMLPSDFERFIVQPMRPEQVDALTERWCTAVYPPQDALVEARKLQDEIAALEAIRKKQGEVPLVDTPLMVTIVAIVHWNNRVLPQQRAALYEKCVTALLAEQHKEDEGQGQSRPDLEKRGGSLDAKVGQLARLAYEMMRSSTDKEAGRSASREQIEGWLLPLFQQLAGSADAPTQLETFRLAMCDRASILHERNGLHQFTHLTFQEFLCAYYLATNESPAEIAAFFQAEDRVLYSWWRETILLTIGYLGKTAIVKSLKLVQKMVSLFSADAPGLAAAELAAAGLLELESPAPDDRQAVHDCLVTYLSDPAFSAPLALRALAGQTLSRLGDKRPGVGVDPVSGLPAIAWSQEVPMGTYVYQDTKHKITHPYRLACYPVTYCQFQTFIEADDFADSRWWADMPPDSKIRELKKQAFPFDNHPRETVSWYQAVAFCRWLSDKLVDQEITLPTEQEWEVAARYPDGRTYPWGNEFAQEKANTDEGGVGQTTAVGIYPVGKNEVLNLYDMSGNVWEWCSNKYTNPDDIQIDDSSDGRVLRGGSWYDDANDARAAARDHLRPYGLSFNYGFRVVVRRSPSQDH